jgi:carbamoyltransferase
LAAYGRPVYRDTIRQLIDLKEDGSFRLNMEYFSFREGFQMWNRNFERLFGAPRLPGAPLSARDKDLAASIQAVVEEVYFAVLRHLAASTGLQDLCVSGGSALNSLANGKLWHHTPFKNAYILGPAGDGGAALGAALFAYHGIRNNSPRREISDLRLGPEYGDAQVEAALRARGVAYRRLSSDHDLLGSAADALAQGKVLGWFQGRAEFGPRALGSRSILADPSSAAMKDRVNEVKRREEFRPFAGSVMEERFEEYFEAPHQKHGYPFMNFCFPVRAEKKKELAAIVHEDGTCRVQSVSPAAGAYHRLLQAFGERTGTYCLLNTSFNVKGEPMVSSPEEAIDDFMNTSLDCLCIGNFFADKE